MSYQWGDLLYFPKIPDIYENLVALLFNHGVLLVSLKRDVLFWPMHESLFFLLVLIKLISKDRSLELLTTTVDHILKTNQTYMRSLHKKCVIIVFDLNTLKYVYHLLSCTKHENNVSFKNMFHT